MRQNIAIFVPDNLKDCFLMDKHYSGSVCFIHGIFLLFTIMNNDAIAIANYFVDKSKSDSKAPYPLTLLRLVKYVYIAYGFALSILNKSIIDKRFDKVEAWKYGPVIPSVYHSFKHNGNEIIRDKISIVTEELPDGDLRFEIPEIKDKDVVQILDFVWDRYRDKPTSYLIYLLHREDTPWAYCYRVGKNVEIPEEMTKVYYDAIVNRNS